MAHRHSSMMVVLWALLACSGPAEPEGMQSVNGGGAGTAGEASGGSTSSAGGTAGAENPPQGGSDLGGGGTGVAGAPVGGSAGATNGGANDGGGGSVTGGPHGVVQIVAEPIFGSSLWAWFERTESVDESCTTTQEGECVLRQCPNGVVMTPGSAAGSPNAGMISVTAVYPPEPQTMISGTITPEPAGPYPIGALSERLGGGEVATVTAVGAEVPAFEATINMPLSLLLSTEGQPVGTPADTILLSRQADTALAWERGADGVFLVLDGSNNDGASTHLLTCNFPSAAGVATVPAGIVSTLQGVTLSLYTAVYDTVQAGDYTVSVRAAGPVVNSDRTEVMLATVE